MKIIINEQLEIPEEISDELTCLCKQINILKLHLHDREHFSQIFGIDMLEYVKMINEQLIIIDNTITDLKEKIKTLAS